jgi:hypothetical protein
VKLALVNNRNQENEIKKVSSNPHLLIATEISEQRPLLHIHLLCRTGLRISGGRTRDFARVDDRPLQPH